MRVESDDGNFERLMRLHRNDPADLTVVIDLLRVSQDRTLVPGPTYAALVDNLPETAWSSPEARMLMALRAGRYGRLQIAAEQIDALIAMGLAALSHCMQDVDDLLNYVLHLLADGERADAERAAPAILALHFLRQETTGDIEHAVREVAYTNKYRLIHPAANADAALRLVWLQIGYEGKAALIDLLVAERALEDANTLVMEGLLDATSASSASFTRAAANCAIQRCDANVERFALARFRTEGGAKSALERTRRLEVLERRSRLAADRPLDVFVGFFGQARSADQSLPHCIDALERGFAASREGPFNLHFGLSTWARTGVRELELGHSVDFFAQLLPEEARGLINAEFGLTGEALQKTFPALIASMLSFTQRQSRAAMDATTLAPLLPGCAEIVIGDEGQIERDVEDAHERAGLGRVAPNLNQFKMWASIANLATALSAHEQRLDRRIDAVMLLRSDLIFVDGPVGALVCRAVSPYERNKVFSDHDPHAEFIAGAGDRYVILARDHVDVLFEGYQRHLSAASASDERAMLRRRNNGHESLATLLFQAGLAHSPVADVRYLLHRLRMPPELVRTALESDLHADARAVDRDRFVEVLSALSLRVEAVAA